VSGVIKLKIEFLGTGGAMTIPRPLCRCRVCEEARTKGVPYSRSGPSLFVHGPNLLFDTPEDIYYQINRSNITEINAVFYSHWHPDHVMGRRILESLNADWVNDPPKNKQTDVYLPEQVAIDFNHRLGSGEHLQFFSQQGYIRLHELKDGDCVWINDTEIWPFRLAEDYVYAFLLKTNDKKVLIALDELNNWKPGQQLQGVDLAVLPIGIFEYHPLTGERLIISRHPVLKEEATFAETLEMIKELNPKKTILTHIEEMNGLSFDELKKVEKLLNEEGLNIEIAYDTLVVDV
jgi:phosphoribosyl 1,2-cyclic phosphate phosphodiesterase